MTVLEFCRTWCNSFGLKQEFQVQKYNDDEGLKVLYSGDFWSYLHDKEWQNVKTMSIKDWLFDYKNEKFVISVFEEDTTMGKSLNVLDRMEEIRQKAAEHPEQYPLDNTIRILSAIVAEAYGYESRTDWTNRLKELPESRYYKRYYGETGEFHS